MRDRVSLGDDLTSASSDGVGLFALRRVIEALIIIATASLIYYRKITVGGALTLHFTNYRSDFAYFAAALLALIECGIWIRTRKSFRLEHLTQLERVVFLALALFLGSTLLATLLSFFRYHLWFDSLGFGEFSKMFLGVILFVITYVHLRQNFHFFRWLALSLYVPPFIALMLGVMFLVDPIRYQKVIGLLPFSPSGWCGLWRFQGLTSNPTQAALSSLVAISFLWPLTLVNGQRGRWWQWATGLVCIGGMAFAGFWTMSRSGLMALALIIVFASFVISGRVARTVGTIVAVLVVVASAWFLESLAAGAFPPSFLEALAEGALAPKGDWIDVRVQQQGAAQCAVTAPVTAKGQLSRPLIAQRMPSDHPAGAAQPPAASAAGGSPVGSAPAVGGEQVHHYVEAALSNPTLGRMGDSRILLWRHFGTLALTNPFGIGFNYGKRFAFDGAYQVVTSAESIILSTWMLGGVVGVIGLGLFLFAIKGAVLPELQRRENDWDFVLYVGAASACICVLAIYFFLGTPFSDFLSSVLFAMALAGVPKRSQ